MSWKDLLKSFAFWRNPLSHNFGKCDQPPIHCNSSLKQLQQFISITFTFQLPYTELQQLYFVLQSGNYVMKSFGETHSVTILPSVIGCPPPHPPHPHPTPLHCCPHSNHCYHIHLHQSTFFYMYSYFRLALIL